MEFWSWTSTVKGPRQHHSGSAVARRLTVLLLLALATSMGTGGVKPAHAATTIAVECTTDASALASALANASDGDTLAIEGRCNGTFEISHSLTLDGVGGATLDGGGSGPVVTVDLAATVVVNDLTITGGNSADRGGGIYNNGGTVTLNNSTVKGNAAGAGGGVDSRFRGISFPGELTLNNTAVSDNRAAVGGGIYADGDLTVNNSSVTGNSATGYGGGGIYSPGGESFTLNSSTISGNSGDVGGGIATPAGTIENSTISGNSAIEYGGGIYKGFTGSLSIESSTISDNSAGLDGGGIWGAYITTFSDTIVAHQTAGGNCTVFGADGGYNLDDGTSCGFSSANNSLSNTDPLLDSAGLQDNGGPTQTIALQPGSPAIDAIPSTVNGCGTTITTDQRGISRPQGPGCDIGAFELVPPKADLAITKSGEPNRVVSGNRLTYTVTITNNGPQAATGVTVTDPLPGNVHFDSVGSSQGSCTRSTAKPAPKDATVTCTLGNLANGASAEITIVVTTTTPGTLTNTATARGNEADPNPLDNSATATTTVIGT
jgi:uncharacterized repeat protein (TIGR01451 family)